MTNHSLNYYYYYYYICVHTISVEIVLYDPAFLLLFAWLFTFRYFCNIYYFLKYYENFYVCYLITVSTNSRHYIWVWENIYLLQYNYANEPRIKQTLVIEKQTTKCYFCWFFITLVLFDLEQSNMKSNTRKAACLALGTCSLGSRTVHWQPEEGQDSWRISLRSPTPFV